MKNRFFSFLLFSLICGSICVAGESRVRVRSWDQVKYAGETRQKFDFSCGASCLGSILHQEGIPYIREEEVVREVLSKRNPLDKEHYYSGLSLLEMKHYMEAKGFRSAGIEPEYDQLDKLIKHGWVVSLICPMGHPHFIILLSANNSVVHYFDPTIGLRRVKRSVFQSIWKKSSLFVFPNNQ